MQPSFWRERWEKGEIGFHQLRVNADLRLHWPALKCLPDSRVFVPLCGKSRDMSWLHAQGHRVLGVELSELAVAEFFAEQELLPVRRRAGPLECWQAERYELYVGDFFKLRARQLADVRAVYDRAALIALPPPLRAQYARHLTAILPADCRMLLLTMDYPQEQMAGPPFAVGEPEVRELFDTAFSVTLLATRDALLDEPRFQQRGLKSRHDQAYLLAHRPQA